MLLFACLIRIGEAQNPGPSSQSDDHSLGLTLGSVNPTGVLYKGAVFNQLPQHQCAVWGVAESHLTNTGISRFRRELRALGNKYQYHPGHPVPYRSQALTAVGGKQLGVGFVANVPSRRLQFQDDHQVLATNRLAINTFRCGQSWVHGAIFYGFAQRAYSVEVKQQSDSILQSATTKLVYQMKGYRFIMGDFNQQNGQLNQTHLWSQLGWKEVQLLRQDRTGEEVEVTCRGSTTVDFLWISPELVSHLEKVEVIHGVVPDHSIVAAHFSPFLTAEKIPMWRTPKPISWSEGTNLLDNSNFQVNPSDSPEDQMIAIAREFEQQVDTCLRAKGQRLQECQQGRSTTFETKIFQPKHKPLKPSRHGEIDPNFHGQSAQHLRWFTQLRRIASLERHFARRVAGYSTCPRFPWGVFNVVESATSSSAGSP